MRIYKEMLQRLAIVTLAPCAGKRRIINAKQVFWHLDSRFESVENNFATALTQVSVYQIDEDGTFADLFSSLARDVKLLQLSQAQVIEFCSKHRDLLREDSYGTFFLLNEGTRFVVASVVVNGSRLRACPIDYSSDCIWHATCCHRIVVPFV